MKRKQLVHDRRCRKKAVHGSPNVFEKSGFGLWDLNHFNTGFLITVAERLRHDRQSPHY